MKNLLIITAVIFMPIGLAQAGIIEKLTSLGDKLVETYSYTVEAKMWNLRAYTWTDPKSGLYCIYVAGENKGGLSCNPIEKND